MELASVNTVSNASLEYRRISNYLVATYELKWGYDVEIRKYDGSEYLFLRTDGKLVFIVRLLITDRVAGKILVRDELSKFRNIGSKEKCFNFRLIVPKGFSDSAQAVEQFNMILSSVLYLDNLARDNFRFELYPHNQITYERIERMFEVQNKVGIIQPTGTGKSVLIGKYIYDNQGKVVVVMSPNKFVFRQLKKFISLRENIRFLTYSKAMMLSNEDIKSLNADIIVLDEYHRVGAEEWGQAVESILNVYPDCKVFGTSATPTRMDDRNMANELFGVNIACNLSLSKAIQELIVPAPYYVNAIYSLDDEIDKLKDKIANSKSGNKDELIERILIAKNDWEKTKGVEAIIRTHVPLDAKKFLVFCKDIDHLKRMKDSVRNWFKNAGFDVIKCFEVHSENRDSLAELEEFERTEVKGLCLLFSVDMLNEGLHVNNVDGEMFLRRTDSKIVYNQQLGRSIVSDFSRKPVILDLVNNFRPKSWSMQSGMERSYSYPILGLEDFLYGLTVIDEVRDVRELFESFSNEIESFDIFVSKLKDFFKIYGHCNVPQRYEDNWLGSKVTSVRRDYTLGRLTASEVKILNDLKFTWNPKTELIGNFVIELLGYKREFGDFDVPYHYSKASLGRRVSYVRSRFRRNILSVEWIQALNDIKFNWELGNPLISTVDSFYEFLKEFKKENGHIDFSNELTRSQSSKATSVRRLFKEGRLSSVQARKYEELGFVWDVGNFKYREFLEDLKKFKKEFGHFTLANVLNENSLLAFRIRSFRKKYRKGELSAEEIEELESVGMSWTEEKKVYDNNSFLKFFDEVLGFKRRMGHLIFWGGDLDKWMVNKIQSVRQAYSKGTLSLDQIKMLESIGFSWSHEEESYKLFIEKLRDYQRQYGNCDVPINYTDKWLGRKVSRIRGSYKSGKLDQGRIVELESLGFKWKKNHGPLRDK